MGPKFSKLFQGKSKLFQGNSKLFQAFSKEFQRYSLAVFSEIKGLAAAQTDFAFFDASAPELPSRCARARRTLPVRVDAEVSFLPLFLFFRNQMSRRSGGRSIRGRRSRHGVGRVSPMGRPLGEAAANRRRSLGCENSD
jgi:hypothetical protein